jgi:hypothetical protein
MTSALELRTVRISKIDRFPAKPRTETAMTENERRVPVIQKRTRLI